MGLLKRSHFLNGKSSLRIKKLPTPGWPDGSPTPYVYIRALSAADGDDFERLCAASREGKLSEAQLQARWCVLGICDKAGKRLLKEADATALLARSLIQMQQCALEVMRLNGMGESAAKKP